MSGYWYSEEMQEPVPERGRLGHEQPVDQTELKSMLPTQKEIDQLRGAVVYWKNKYEELLASGKQITEDEE
jgi:hypothetical protein